MKKIVSILLLFIIVIAIWGGIAYIIYRSFFMPNSAVVPAFTEDGIHVVIEEDVIGGLGDPRIIDGEILLPLQLIKEHIDPHINWDAPLHKLTITSKDKVIRMKTGSLDAFMNNKPLTLNIPAVEEEGEVLVPIGFLGELYGIDAAYHKENNVIVIDFKNRDKQIAEPIHSDAVIRTGYSIFEPIVKKMEGAAGEESELRIYGEYEKWYKVRAADGTIGFIEKKYVSAKRTLAASLPQKSDSPVWKPEAGKINMAWDYAWNVKFNSSKKTAIEGLDVISPTWFQVVGTDGELLNNADKKYVEWAHEKGYQVWALFSNSFDNPTESGNFLNNSDSRDNAIRQLLAFAALYELDGINIDFENLRSEDKDALTQFVREMAPLLREQGLVVSIDVNMLPCYDRKALGDAVDYVALMAYDQHWRGGGVAGSVSQVSWTDRIVQTWLKDVLAEKLILGVPFYTRLWIETTEDGKAKLTSQALSMNQIEKFLKDNNAEKTWDTESGQFYSEFVKEGVTYKVWLEDEHSLNLRTSLVHKYELAGTAAWRLDFELPRVWEVINRNLKVFGSYSEWKLQNQNSQYAYTE